jgi:hypothetical protein
MDEATIITLKNGIRIANFSSPHPFRFVTGEVLPPCSDVRANGMALNPVETESANPGGWKDVSLRFELTPQVTMGLDQLEANEEMDVILVPFPVMEALKRAGRAVGKCRVIRTANRVTKEIHSDVFCI